MTTPLIGVQVTSNDTIIIKVNTQRAYLIMEGLPRLLCTKH